jgi:HEXXH motif-containing protein
LLQKRITGVCPLWAHLGHVHAIAAAAAIRADLDFDTHVPMWEGGVILPTLGLARMTAAESHAVARVRSSRGRVEITHGNARVILPDRLDTEHPDWWGVRRLTATAENRRLDIRLDDVDPYRGLHEPVLPRRIDGTEGDAWREQLSVAWELIARHVPHLADSFPAGLDSVAPWLTVPARNASASTGEAFGSALIARPPDGATLAATLVHEFQHIVLGGILHLVHLYEDDPRDRYYVPWRPDPRPLSGALTGVYAFFGVAGFWREVARENGLLRRRAMFEFAQARSETWRVLGALQHDASLTTAGRRFVDGIADKLEPWQNEPVPDDLLRRAEAITMDHHGGWRMRHIRPSRHIVEALAQAWLAGRPHPPTTLVLADPMPTPVQDGTPSQARADLIRLGIVDGKRLAAGASRRLVPDATAADLAYATGRFADAARGYRAELARYPDRVSSWVGLGLALHAVGTGPAARALTHYPELVRAVRRQIGTSSSDVPTPERLAAWLGQGMY